MMQSQTFYGTLQVEESTRPSFGVVILNWIIYFLLSRFLMMMQPNLFGIFLRYLAFFIALTTTFSFLFTPRYYSIFRPSKTESGEIQKISTKTPNSDDSKSTAISSSIEGEVPQKIKINSSNSDDSKSTITSSSIESEVPQKLVISSNKTITSQFCPECGAKIDYTGRYCTACGSPIRV